MGAPAGVPLPHPARARVPAEGGGTPHIDQVESGARIGCGLRSIRVAEGEGQGPARCLFKAFAQKADEFGLEDTF